MKALFVLFFLIFLTPSVASAKCFEASENIQEVGELKTVLRCFEEEISTLKKLIKKGGGKSIIVNAVPGLPEPQVSMSTESHNLKFDLLECKRKSRIVRCSFRLTNMGDDVRLSFYNNSRAFDEFGKEYKPGLSNIVDASADLGSTSYVSKHLISGVPVRARMAFNGIPKESTQFTALNLLAHLGQKFLVKFRNVAIID